MITPYNFIGPEFDENGDDYVPYTFLVMGGGEVVFVADRELWSRTYHATAPTYYFSTKSVKSS